jgi:hypothetical protein
MNGGTAVSKIIWENDSAWRISELFQYTTSSEPDLVERPKTDPTQEP